MSFQNTCSLELHDVIRNQRSLTRNQQNHIQIDLSSPPTSNPKTSSNVNCTSSPRDSGDSTSNNVNIIRSTNANSFIEVSSPIVSPISETKSIKPSSNKMANNQGVSSRSMSAAGSTNTRLNMSNATSSPSKSSHANTRKEEFQLYYQKCMRGISHSINIITAVMMRLVFSLHSLIAIVYVYLVKQDEWYFVNFVGVVFLLIELFITIIRRKGKEPRWYFYV